MSGLASVPVEQVRVGDRIMVSRRIGLRRVLEIEEYDRFGLEHVDCFVLVYQAGPGQAWENRSGRKGVVSRFPRDRTLLRPLRRGDLVEVERLHLVERN